MQRNRNNKNKENDFCMSNKIVVVKLNAKMKEKPLR